MTTDEGLRFRLYPTKEQAEKLNRTFGNCRFVFNHFLAKREEYYSVHGVGMPQPFKTQCNELTVLRAEKEWLAETSQVAQQQSLRNLDTAYVNFYKHGAEHPKFKSKKRHEDSFKLIHRTKNPLIENGKIKIPTIGEVKIVQSRPLEGKVSSFVVSRTPSGKYFVSILCVDVEKKPLPKTGKSVGIDFGIKAFATFSDGTVVEGPKNLAKKQKRRAREQKKLSRKTMGSKNWEKQRVKVARCFEKEANCKRDFNQKFTTMVVRNYDEIYIEDLDVKGMLEDDPRKLARRVSDANFGEVARELVYKGDWYGKTVTKRDRYFPSSQRCSVCYKKNEEVKDLSVREWECPYCHTVHDRDLNAAINLLLGEEALPTDCREVRPLEGLVPNEEGIPHA